MFAASWNEPSFDAPSPKNATATFFVFLNFCVNAAPIGDRRTAADDAVRAEHAELHVADVHAAAFAFAVAGGAAEQFGEHAIELAAFRDEVTVTAVRAGDLVVVGQVHHHAGGDRFLTYIKVQGAGNLAGFHQLAGFFLEDADADHAAVNIEQNFVVRLLRQNRLP